MSVVARSATQADARYLAPRLLPEDAAEVRAASGLAPLDVLLGGVELSDDCGALVTSDRYHEPICMWGVRRVFDNVGMIWLLCGENLHQHRVGFLKESRKVFKRYEQQYPILWNLVDERNTAHVRFLEWHGCTFIKRHETFGPERRPFIEFVRPSCVTR